MDNVVEFVKVKATPRLSAAIVITMSDGSTKTAVLREGDRVTNLTYIEDGVTYVVTGDVKVINYTVKTVRPSTDTTCVHNTVSDFDTRVTVNNLIVDCSDVYSSDIRVIPISYIRNFDSTDVGEMVVSDVRLLSESSVSFVSTEPPVAAIWNGDSVIPTRENDDSDVYTIPIQTMQRVNTLIVIDSDNRCKVDVKGLEPQTKLTIDLSNSVETLVNTFLDTYLEKFPDNLDVEVPDEEYYVTVASGITDTDEILMGGDIYNVNNSTRLKIGENSYVNKAAFKIVDRDLMIAAPLLYTLTDKNGNLEIVANGFTFTISIIKTLNALTLDESSIVGVGQKFWWSKHNVVVNADGSITEDRQDGMSKIQGTLLTSEGTAIPAGTILAYKKVYADETGTSFRLERVGDDPTTMVNLYNYLEDALVTEEATASYTYSIHALSYGSINVTITTTETIPVEKDTAIVGGVDSDFDTITDAIAVLNTGDTVELAAGTYTDQIDINKSIRLVGSSNPEEETIISALMVVNANDGGTFTMENISYKNVESPEGTGNMRPDAKGNGILVSGNCDVEMKNVEIAETNYFYNVMQFTNTGKVVMDGCNFGDCLSYHMVEFGYSKLVEDGTTIQNCNFGVCRHNVISLYRYVDNATVTIKDCVFARSANAVRVSNMTSATAVLNFENCTYLDTAVKGEDGLVMIQKVGTEDYTPLTFNFSNIAFVVSEDQIIKFTSRVDEETGYQLWYQWVYTGDYSEGFPTVTYA